MEDDDEDEVQLDSEPLDQGILMEQDDVLEDEEEDSIEVDFSHGPLTAQQKYLKVKAYLEKKYNKAFRQKHKYICRQQVAEKRLRIKGRFVTKQQAFEILGLTEGQLLDNVKIQELLTEHAENPMQVNSLIENGTG